VKASELRALTDVELVGKIDDLKSEWQTLRFDEAVGKLTDTNRIRSIKRDIARVKTIQTERVMAAELERSLAG
jgi:large subunit ribosomal protein L29